MRTRERTLDVLRSINKNTLGHTRTYSYIQDVILTLENGELRGELIFKHHVLDNLRAIIKVHDGHIREVCIDAFIHLESDINNELRSSTTTYSTIPADANKKISKNPSVQ